jgi:hypothetical protein
MKRRYIVVGLAVLGLGVVAAVLYGQWQMADRQPHRYVECGSSAIGPDCDQASRAFDDCQHGRYSNFGRSNCRRVIDLHAACARRKGTSNDITCRVVAYDYLKCTTSGHGAAACYLIEQAFLGCLDSGHRDVSACKATRGQRMDCLYPKNLNKEHCRQLNEEILNTSTPALPLSLDNVGDGRPG